jgi:hypothetical protein
MSSANEPFKHVRSGSSARRKPSRRQQRCLSLEALEPKKLLSASQPTQSFVVDPAVEVHRIVPALFAQQETAPVMFGDCFVEQVAQQIRAVAPTTPNVPIEIVPLSLVSQLAAKPPFTAAGFANRMSLALQDPPPGGGGANQGPVAQPGPNAPRQEVSIRIEWGDLFEDADGKTTRDGKIIDDATKKEIGTAHEETVPDKDKKGKPTGTTTTTTTERYDSGKIKVTEVVKGKDGKPIKTTTTEWGTDANGNDTVKQTVEEKGKTTTTEWGTDANGNDTVKQTVEEKGKKTTTEHGTDKDGKKTVKQTVEEKDKKGNPKTTTTEWKQSDGKWYKKNGDKWVEDKTGPPKPPTPPTPPAPPK